MIITNDTHNAINPRQQQLDQIERIEGIVDDGQRWRAIQQFMFKLHPELVTEDRLHCAAVVEKRLEQRSQTGSSKSGAMRALYSMPDYLYRAFQVFDPSFQKTQSSKDRQAIKRLNHKLWRVFSEYRLAEKI
jgi:hypothetical protein